MFTWQGNLFCKNLNDKNIFSVNNAKEIELMSYFTEEKLAKEMYQISCNDIYSSSLSSLESFCKNSLKKNQENCFSTFFIYLHNRKLSAYLNINIAFDVAEIDYISVHESYKRQGISIELFQLFEEKCKQDLQMLITKIILEVGAHNLPALSLYKKLSFQEISVRKKYYKNGEDAVVMEKIL